MIKNRKALEALIDRLLIVDGFSLQNVLFESPDLDLKIALLSLLLEELRYEREHDADIIDFEKYVRCDISTYGSAIIIKAPEHFQDVGTGTAPIQLQSPLLVFLLLHHRERFPVLDIIQLFIENVRPGLTFLDFKKTKTGVTRCFTNTRFAAHVLRDYGLLKFTYREAYKTWELSLMGFLVAAEILKNPTRKANPGAIPSLEKEANFDLAREVRTAYDQIKDYEAFVDSLASICKPNVSFFETFEAALRNAYLILGEYWEILKNSGLTQKARKEASQACVKQLEKEGIDDRFYGELSSCIKNGDEVSSQE